MQCFFLTALICLPFNKQQTVKNVRPCPLRQSGSFLLLATQDVPVRKLLQRFLPKDIKDNFVTVLPVILRRFETGPLTLCWHECNHKVRIFWNTAARKISGAKKDEVREQFRMLRMYWWRKKSLYRSPSILRILTFKSSLWASNEIRRDETRNAYRIIVGNYLWKRGPE